MDFTLDTCTFESLLKVIANQITIGKQHFVCAHRSEVKLTNLTIN